METGYKSESYCMGQRRYPTSLLAKIKCLISRGKCLLSLHWCHLSWALTVATNIRGVQYYLKQKHSLVEGPLWTFAFPIMDIEQQAWHYICLVLKWLILVFAALFIWRRMLKKSLAGNWFMEMCFVLQRKACCFLSCLGVVHRFSSCCFSL